MANELRVKVCTKCSQEKSTSEFSLNRAARDGRASECKACKKVAAAKRYAANKASYDARNKAYYEANRDATLARQKVRQVEKRDEIKAYQRNYRLMKSYGITEADYKAMEAAQNGRCYVCQNPEPVHPRLPVDHCHATGQVRKLLCTPCNIALGAAADDPARLRALAAYVEGHYQ